MVRVMVRSIPQRSQQCDVVRTAATYNGCWKPLSAPSETPQPCVAGSNPAGGTRLWPA